MMTTACNAAKSNISENICYTLNVSKYYYNELNMLSETFLMSNAIVLVCKLNLKDSEYYSNKFYYMAIFNRCYCDSEA